MPETKSPGVKLHHQSCEKMDQVEDCCVSLTVTSPPYWNAINYDRHATQPGAWFRTREGEPYEEYLDFMSRCFAEVYRTTKPSGFCAVIIGTVLQDHRHYPLPFHLVGRMEQVGWRFHQNITWHKVTGGVKRARVFIQKPYPGYYYPNMMTEQILIFRKPGEKPIYHGRSAEERSRDQVPIDLLFKKEIANDVWHIAPVPHRQFDHPCPFPEEIPLRLIMLYSYRGERVLDPFVGIGTTAKVALRLGREAIGYDTEKKYVTMARKRCQEPLCLRKAQLIAEFGKLPTPPIECTDVSDTHKKARTKSEPSPADATLS